MKTLVILKPDALERGLSEILIQTIQSKGFHIEEQKTLTATHDLLTKHYPESMAMEIAIKMSEAMGKEVAEEDGKAVLNGLRKFMLRGPIKVLVVSSSSENTVSDFRELIGATNPATAKKGTLRGDYGIDSYEESNRTGRPVENLIHASDSNESAEREIKIWFE